MAAAFVARVWRCGSWEMGPRRLIWPEACISSGPEVPGPTGPLFAQPAEPLVMHVACRHVRTYCTPMHDCLRFFCRPKAGQLLCHRPSRSPAAPLTCMLAPRSPLRSLQSSPSHQTGLQLGCGPQAPLDCTPHVRGVAPNTTRGGGSIGQPPAHSSVRYGSTSLNTPGIPDQPQPGKRCAVAAHQCQ